MVGQTIESQDLSLGQLFQEFYLVPDYQREYVWEEKQVEQLLSDILDEFRDAHPDSLSEYFIGSIVVCARSGGLFELIDGQQRLTTIYITICAIRDYFRKLHSSPPQQIETQIVSSTINDKGADICLYRIDLQYEDSDNVLTALAEGKQASTSGRSPTRSVANLINAYSVVLAFLGREFDNDVTLLRRFYAYLSGRVKVIRIRTQSVTHALKIFETINDRGKGLDSMDLLKNLMFMNTKNEQFDKLKIRWKELVDTIYSIDEKPLRFLRYFIFSSYDVDRLREDEIYEWFVKNEARCRYKTNPLGFVDTLVGAAKAYKNFLEGKAVDGSPDQYLVNMQYLAGTARQHLILLLSARHLPNLLFAELCRHVENLFFVYVITREHTRDFERDFVNWAKELRKVESDQKLADFVEKYMVPAKARLSERFDLAFRNLTADSIQKYRLRYLLGKLTQKINETAYGNGGANGHLQTFVNRNVDIEHILPQSPTNEIIEALGSSYADVEQLAQRLGNLVLVEKSLNTSISNKPYSAKRSILAKSTFLLTKCVAEHVEIGVNTKIDRAVAGLESYKYWTADAIQRRQETLHRLARVTWDVPGAERAGAL